MNKELFGLCAAILVCANLAAQARQNDSATVQELDEVVVSDSRFALKRENSGKTVIKIGSKALERYQGKNIAEIINAKSGLEIGGSRSREGAVFGVFARGGRGRQVLIIVDGVRVSDPSSSSSEYDLRMLSTADIESIEIIKGAASTLYGSNAATAVINIVTKKAAANAMAGSFQSSIGTNQSSGNQNYNLSRSSNSARVSGTLGDFSYLVRVSNRFAEGLSDLITAQNEKDGFSHFSTGLRLGYKIGKKIDVSIYTDQTKFRTDYDESYGLLDAPYQFLSKQERLGTAVNYTYEKGSVNMNAAYAVYNSENISAFASEYEGVNYNLDIYHKYDFNNRFYTLVGLNYLEDRTQFAGQEKFHLIDPYLNAVYVSDFGLNINAGGRLNNHSAYGSNFVYNLNPSFLMKHPSGYFKVLSSYATSYITPSLTQLYGNFGANPDLQPENDRTVEVGFEYSKTGKLRLSTLYFNRSEDQFVFYDLETSSYKNALNTIHAQGVEVELDWSASASIHLSTNYTFTERKGDAAIRIPKHKVNTQLGYDISKNTFGSLQYSFTGGRLDTNFNTFPAIEEPLHAFSLVNLYLSHNCIPDRLKLFFNIDNILNTAYTEVLGYTSLGRNVNLGVVLNL